MIVVKRVKTDRFLPCFNADQDVLINQWSSIDYCVKLTLPEDRFSPTKLRSGKEASTDLMLSCCIRSAIVLRKPRDSSLDHNTFELGKPARIES